MKNQISFSLVEVLIVLTVTALIGALEIPARAQITPTDIKPAVVNDTLIAFTNGTYTFAGVTNPLVSLRQGKELGLFVKGAAAGATLSNIVATAELTPDGTNWVSEPTLTYTFSLNGTTAISKATNWNAVQTG